MGCGWRKCVIGFGPQAPGELQNPQNFPRDRCLCAANEVALGGPKTGSGWGLVTRKLNHLIRGLEPSGPDPGEGGWRWRATSWSRMHRSRLRTEISMETLTTKAQGSSWLKTLMHQEGNVP